MPFIVYLHCFTLDISFNSSKRKDDVKFGIKAACVHIFKTGEKGLLTKNCLINTR